jgi:hypothetical protein
MRNGIRSPSRVHHPPSGAERRFDHVTRAQQGGLGERAAGQLGTDRQAAPVVPHG